MMLHIVGLVGVCVCIHGVRAWGVCVGSVRGVCVCVCIWVRGVHVVLAAFAVAAFAVAAFAVAAFALAVFAFAVGFTSVFAFAFAVCWRRLRSWRSRSYWRRSCWRHLRLWRLSLRLDLRPCLRCVGRVCVGRVRVCVRVMVGGQGAVREYISKVFVPIAGRPVHSVARRSDSTEGERIHQALLRGSPTGRDTAHGRERECQRDLPTRGSSAEGEHRLDRPSSWCD